MCIVIDVNAIPDIFNEKSNDHEDFKPVKNWIVEGKGKMVYGGSKYKDELKKMSKYIRFIGELDKARKVKKLDDDEVDKETGNSMKKDLGPDFDDPHLMAIIIVSGCKLICSKDSRSFKYLKDGDNYPKGMSRPRFYTGARNSDLLKDNNIVKVCMF